MVNLGLYWHIRGEGWRCGKCFKIFGSKMLAQNHALKCFTQKELIEKRRILEVQENEYNTR